MSNKLHGGTYKILITINMKYFLKRYEYNHTCIITYLVQPAIVCEIWVVLHLALYYMALYLNLNKQNCLFTPDRVPRNDPFQVQFNKPIRLLLIFRGSCVTWEGASPKHLALQQRRCLKKAASLKRFCTPIIVISPNETY